MSQRIIAAFLALLLIAVSLGLFGWWGLNSSIGGFYHPNAVQGNYGQAYLWVFELMLLAIPLFALYTIIWDRVEHRIKMLAMAFAVLIAIYVSVSILNLVPRNYHAEYYIGQQKYSIPWQYNPINGSTKPIDPPMGLAGTYFVITVAYPDLKGMYEDKNYSKHELTVAKHVYDGKERIGTSIDDICGAGSPCGLSFASNTYFVDGGFIYQIHYQGDTVTFANPTGVERLKKSIIALFDSFKVNN